MEQIKTFFQAMMFYVLMGICMFFLMPGYGLLLPVGLAGAFDDGADPDRPAIIIALLFWIGVLGYMIY